MPLSLTLYTPPGYYLSSKVLVTLDVCELKYSLIKDYDAKGSAFLAMSPLGKVPVLSTDEGALYESNAIIRLLAVVRPEMDLLGKSFFQHAQVDQWVDFCGADIEVARGVYDYAIASNESLISEGINALTTALGPVEAHLLHETFMVGNGLTLADIAIASAIAPIFSKLDGSKFPNTTRWLDMILHTQGFESLSASTAVEVKLEPFPSDWSAEYTAAAEKVRALKIAKAAPKEVLAAIDAMNAIKAKESPALEPFPTDWSKEYTAAAEKVRALKIARAAPNVVLAAIDQLNAIKAKESGPSLAEQYETLAAKVRSLKAAHSAPDVVLAAIDELLAVKEKMAK